MKIKKMLRKIKKINKMNYDYAQSMKILLIQQENTEQHIDELENENERLRSEISGIIGGVMEELEEKINSSSNKPVDSEENKNETQSNKMFKTLGLDKNIEIKKYLTRYRREIERILKGEYIQQVFSNRDFDMISNDLSLHISASQYKVIKAFVVTREDELPKFFLDKKIVEFFIENLHLIEPRKPINYEEFVGGFAI